MKRWTWGFELRSLGPVISASTMTHEVIGSSSSSSPSSTRSNRLTMTAPDSLSLACSTVATMLPSLSRSIAIWTSSAPDSRCGRAAGTGGAAMVDDDDEAIEGGPQGIGGADIFGHVGGRVLVAAHRAVEGVEHDRGRTLGAELLADRCDHLGVVLHQIERDVDQVERHVGFAACSCRCRRATLRCGRQSRCRPPWRDRPLWLAAPGGRDISSRARRASPDRRSRNFCRISARPTPPPSRCPAGCF